MEDFMRLGQWLLVLLLSLVFMLSAAAASKEETQSPAPAGASQTTGDEKTVKDKDEKAPAQPASGSVPAVKAPAPPVKILKDEGC